MAENTLKIEVRVKHLWLWRVHPHYALIVFVWIPGKLWKTIKVHALIRSAA